MYFEITALLIFSRDGNMSPKKIPSAKKAVAQRAPVKNAAKKPHPKRTPADRSKAPVTRASAMKLAAVEAATAPPKKPETKRLPAKKATKPKRVKKANTSSPTLKRQAPRLSKSANAKKTAPAKKAGKSLQAKKVKATRSKKPPIASTAPRAPHSGNENCPFATFYQLFSKKPSNNGFVSFIATNGLRGDPFPWAKSFLEEDCKMTLIEEDKLMQRALYEDNSFPGSRIFMTQLGDSGENGIWILAPLSHPLATRALLFDEIMEPMHTFEIPHDRQWEVFRAREQRWRRNWRQPEGFYDPNPYQFATHINSEVWFEENQEAIHPYVEFRLVDNSGGECAYASVGFLEGETSSCGPVIEDFEYLDDVAGIALVEQIELYLAEQCHIQFCKLKMATAFEGQHDVVRKYCHFKQDSEGLDLYVHKQIRIDDKNGWYRGLHYQQNHWGAEKDRSDSDEGSDIDYSDDEDDSDDDSEDL